MGVIHHQIQKHLLFFASVQICISRRRKSCVLCEARAKRSVTSAGQQHNKNPRLGGYGTFVTTENSDICFLFWNEDSFGRRQSAWECMSLTSGEPSPVASKHNRRYHFSGLHDRSETGQYQDGGTVPGDEPVP